MEHKKYTYEQLKQAYKKNGYNLLISRDEYNEKYKNHLSNLRCMASCGHEVEISLNYTYNVPNKPCPACRKKAIHEESVNKVMDSVSKLLEKHGCKVVYHDDNATVYRIRVEFTTSCGHGTRKTTIAAILAYERRGSLKSVCRCKKCSYSTRAYETYDISRVIKELDDIGCKFIRKINRKVPLDPIIEFIGKCGHKTRAVSTSIHAGITGVCTRCQNNNKRDVAKDALIEKCKQLGCKLLEYKPNSKGDSTFVCSCGRTFKMPGSFFILRNTGLCPDCVKKFSSEKHMKVCVEKMFGEDNVVPQMRIKSGKGVQRIDVAIPAAHLAIEYNGDQHYKFSRFFYRNEAQFKDSKRRDARKRRWCKKNGYALVEVDGRFLKHKLGNITVESISQEIKKQTGHSVEYFKKILEDGNGKSKKNNS